MSLCAVLDSRLVAFFGPPSCSNLALWCPGLGSWLQLSLHPHASLSLRIYPFWLIDPEGVLISVPPSDPVTYGFHLTMVWFYVCVFLLTL
jgi:hypothetical protein